MQAAFHQGLCLALPHKFDGLGGRIMAVRRFFEREARNLGFRLARRVVNAGGPMRTGAISPSLAASTTPSIEISSHGCATAVVTGGSRRAASTSRV